MYFLQPLFLIGLVAVGIPIAIHLFDLRRYRKVYFSNVDRLVAVQAETKQRRRLRDWLILVARILAIVFLVLAFAQPMIPNSRGRQTAGGTAVSVYIDNSPSMERADTEGTLLEEAKKKAKEVAMGHGLEARFQLLTNEGAGHEYRWLGREDFLAAVDEVEICATTAKLGETARRQSDFLRKSRAKNLYAYEIGDFQQSACDWENFPDDSIPYTLISMEGAEVENVYVDSVQLGAPAFYKGSYVTVNATLRNSGKEDLSEFPVKLFVGGRQRALATADIAGGGKATVEMSFQIEEDSAQQCWIEIDDYPVTFDDKLYFTINVAQEADLLVVSQHGENQALRRLFGNDATVRYHTASPSAIDFSTLNEHSIIILDEVAEISTGLAETLGKYVEEGGTMVLIPAKDADVASHNNLLARLHAPLFESWHNGKLKAVGASWDCDLYEQVFSDIPKDVEMPTVEGYYSLSRGNGTVSQEVIQLASGDAFLSYTPAGEGRFFLFSTPLRSEYTDFVGQSLFVPTLYNMALYSHVATAPFVWIGEERDIRLPLMDASEISHLKSIDGKIDVIPSLRKVGNHSAIGLHGELKEPGNYVLTCGESAVGLSFNLSREESEMSFLDSKAIKKAIKDYGLEHVEVVRNAKTSMEGYVKERCEGRSMARWLVLAALLMLLAEEALLRIKI